MERLSLFIGLVIILITQTTTKPKRILFITWDSDQSNYLESLFFPIFHQLQRDLLASFHVLQFSWASQTEVSRIAQLASERDIAYSHFEVFKKVPSAFGAFLSLFIRKQQIVNLIKSEKIEVLMPRSTMPAWLTLMIQSDLRKLGIPVVFDADGLPIQERIDFAGLNPRSLLARMLNKIERNTLFFSNQVITRSTASIAWHLRVNPTLDSKKFSKVINGRDASQFSPKPAVRSEIREKLGIRKEDIVLVHSGSLGKAYDLDSVFRVMKKSKRLKLLILTRNQELAYSLIPKSLEGQIIVLTCPFSAVPDYLNAADIGVSLRTSAPSLAGLAPIKLGEYLLCGLRVWVNPEIGDVQAELNDSTCVFAESPGNVEECLKWMINSSHHCVERCRNLGLRYYSLEAAVSSYQQVLAKL